MPERDTTSAPPAFPLLTLTLAERDLLGWYFPLPTAQTETPELVGYRDRQQLPRGVRMSAPDGPDYIAIPIAEGPSDGCLKLTLAAERERVAELHGGLR
jgi:hypothetical protein